MRRVLTAAAVLILAACTQADTAASSGGDGFVDTVDGLPASAPAQFSFGTDARA